MQALLNIGAILSIEYDNVKYKEQPEAVNILEPFQEKPDTDQNDNNN